MKQTVLMASLVMSGFGLTVHAQSNQIWGKVLDAQTGQAISGATVLMLPSQASIGTDDAGAFRISGMNTDKTVEVRMVGYKPLRLPTGGTQMLLFRLEKEDAFLDEVVVTGYQKERKKDLTGAVQIADVNAMKKQTAANPMKALQGQVPGMFVTGNGAPSSPATIRIRGIGTLNNNDPLFIIDGVPTKAGMHELNQADIESIQVLKDASSASIYGSRAANGVIIITTKHGKTKGTQVEVNGFGALASYGSRVKMLDTQGYGQVQWQAYVNGGKDPNSNTTGYQYDWSVDPQTGQPKLNHVFVPEYLDQKQTMKSANTDWFNEIAQTGVVQNYDAQIINGTENGSYLFSLGYYDNKGIIKTTGFNRLSARLNSDYKLFGGKVTIGQNLSLTKTKEVATSPINEAFQALPIIPVHTVDGKGWGGPVAGMNDRQNPARILADNQQNGYHFMRIFGNFFADIKLMPNLTFRSNFGIDYGDYTARNWQKKYESGYLNSDINKVTNRQSHSVKTNWSNTLNYDLVQNEHRLNVLLGTEYNVDNFNSFMASREGYVTEDPDFMYIDAGTGIKDNAGAAAKSVLLSYFAKANYSYKDRYLLSATVRRDGSSRFGENNRYGTFPAFSIGWRLSEEAFMNSLKSVLSDLKFRFGWGKTGNQEIDNLAIYNVYKTDYNLTAYDINGKKSGVLPSGFYLSQNANPNLRWEATDMSNLGLDFAFWGQTLSGSVDVYQKKTKDILILPPYIGVLGEGGNRWVNGASMDNKGLEVALAHKSTWAKDWSLSIAGNLDMVRNKVIYLPEEVINAYGGDGRGQHILGRTYGSFFGYVADGLFRSQAEVNNGIDQPGKGLGRIRFKDLNGDQVINDQDRTWIGNPVPRLTYGLNVGLSYKELDLSFFLQGVGKVDVLNDFKKFTHFWSAAESSSNKGTALLEAWSTANPSADIPAIALTDENWEARLSTYHIENGAYLKLRNLQVGYTVRPESLKRIKLSQLRFYVGGDNLALLYKSKSFTGVDPETPGFGYPNPTIWTAGLHVKF